MRLKDKVAIVTGGAQGIGRAYCLRYAKEGAAVAIVDLREDGAKKVEAEIAEMGGQALAISADVSSEKSTVDMAKQVADRFGGIDILMNNAAIYYDMDMTDQSIDYLKKMLDVNLLGVLITSRAVFPYMKERGGGSIINISSTAAYPLPAPAMPADNFGSYAYGLAKSGVIYLTKSMAKTGGPANVRVNAIAPGVTMSEATKKVVPTQILDMLQGASSLGKHLQPEDLTGTATFLASEDSAFMTGQTLVVDAGVWMNG